MFSFNIRGYVGRYRQIAAVLLRHGLSDLVTTLGLQRFAAPHRRILGRSRQSTRRTRPEHLRMALEELGVTFIKLGQVLASRGDLLPPEYQRELAKLQDAAAPVPYAVIEEVIIADLGRPIDQIFATFDAQPLAAASIGQAHAATLLDGTEVVVKVRRPDAVAQVDIDLRILEDLAATANRHWALARQYDLVGLAHEFGQTLRAELDYLREGRSAESIAANFADDPHVHIPRVYWEHTTSRVLTLERIRGIKISEIKAWQETGVSRSELGQRLSQTMMKMLFEGGLFHADPHPGNFFVEPAGRLGIIDFGMVGFVDEPTQQRLIDLLLAVTSRDIDRLVDVLLDLGVSSGSSRRELLRQDISHLFFSYYDRPMEEVELRRLINEVLSIMRRHYLQLPANLALLLKALVMLEGLSRQIDPSLNQTTVMAPYARRLVRRRLSPQRVLRQARSSGLEMLWLTTELPVRLRRLVNEMERGQLEVRVRPTGFEEIVNKLDRLANRIVLGIIVAALMNLLAILLSIYSPTGKDQFLTAIFYFGLVTLVFSGLYLMWRFFRSGRG